MYPDADSSGFSTKRTRRLQQFAAGLVLREEDRHAQLDLAQTAVCAAKSAELENLESEERLRVVYAGRRPLWFAILLWLLVGLCVGASAGLTALLVRGVCALLGVTLFTSLIPLWIGSACGGIVFFVMLLLTILGRRKL